MAVPDGFFACGGGADVIEGDGDFDQFFECPHRAPPSGRRLCPGRGSTVVS